MGKFNKLEFGRFVAPLSAVVAAALAGVVVIGGQSPSQATAAVAPVSLSSAQVAAFKPFADEPVYKPAAFTAPVGSTVVYEVAPSMVAAPQTAMPVYGNVVNDERPTYVNRVTPSDSGNGTGGTTLRSATASAGSLDTSSNNLQFSDATITVGTATINVLSSFKLNYGGKTILTGTNGHTSVP